MLVELTRVNREEKISIRLIMMDDQARLSDLGNRNERLVMCYNKNILSEVTRPEFKPP